MAVPGGPGDAAVLGRQAQGAGQGAFVRGGEAGFLAVVALGGVGAEPGKEPVQVGQCEALLGLLASLRGARGARNEQMGGVRHPAIVRDATIAGLLNSLYGEYPHAAVALPRDREL